MARSLRRIGVLGFEGVTGLDLVGPIEAFAHAADIAVEQGAHKPYEVIVIGVAGMNFETESGVRFRAHTALADAPALDTLIVPGGRGLRAPATNARVARFIADRAPRVRRVVSVCTGIYGVAPSGVLDGRRVATHWRFARDVAQRFARLCVDGDALYVRDGRFATSGGITAGIDLSLALIEDDLGPRIALAAAREMVVYVKRPGGQAQFSDPLRYQTRAADRFADLVAWIDAHLGEDLPVSRLAERACLSPRQFARRFTAALGTTPARHVEDVRLAEARRRLAEPGASIADVATSVGFASADAFRRAFERRFGVAPSVYRERFHAGSGPASNRRRPR